MHLISGTVSLQTKTHTRKVHGLMLHETYSSEKTKNIFLQPFTTLKLLKLLLEAVAIKSKEVPVMDIFKFLVSLVFQGKNLCRFLNSFHKRATFSKNSVNRILN